MKAKIKATGEIIQIASYAKIALDQCDSCGNPIELKPEEVELINDVTEDEHCQDVRERAAIAAMQGTITILGGSDRYAFRDVVVEGYRGNEKTFTFYIKGQPYNLQYNFRGNKFSNSEMENAHSSPTHQMAMAWLREIYGIDIVIEISDPSVNDRKYYCVIWNKNNDSYILDLFDSYEEAVEAVLKYVLKNLI